MNHRPIFFRSLALAFVGISAMLVGACNDSGDDLPLSGKLDCKHYCERANDCDDNVDVDKCVDRCIDRMSDCQADEQQEALDKIDACHDVACSDFPGCAIDSSFTCYLGI
ncbi:hypothetical protein ACNOYE_20475 [Nannocystaceae bacterium ST9]